MTRIPMVGAQDLREEDRWLLGDPPVNIAAILAHSPEAFTRLRHLGAWVLGSSSLDPRLRELAIVQVGYSTRCAYEFTHHVQRALSVGATEADIDGLIDANEGRPSSLPELDRAVIAIAHQITVEVEPHDDDFAVVAAALSTTDLVELVLAISFYNSVVRLIRTADVELDPQTLAVSKRFPLPAPA